MAKDGGNKMAEFERKLSAAEKQDTRTVYAATVCLLRDSEAGLEALMLRKNSKIAFGGMWVFPGGRIDDDDGDEGADQEACARAAAIREAEEETGLVVTGEDLVWFSHWTPPELGNRRFITWFYAARSPEGAVEIDGGEILESQWMAPQDALSRHAAGEVELVPPTFVTLHYLSQYPDVNAALGGLAEGGPSYYATRIGAFEDDLVAMWEGDAGYEPWDATIEGSRHRLRMKAGG